MNIPQTNTYQPKNREMIVYLEDNGFRVIRDPKDKENKKIHEMFNITFGTAQARQQRLPPGARDCFGDFNEDMVADCRLSNQDCCLMASCKRLTDLQQTTDKLVAKGTKKNSKAAVTPTTSPKTEPLSFSFHIDSEPEKEKGKITHQSRPANWSPKRKSKKNKYGFSESSKLGQTVMAILPDAKKYPLDQLIKRAAKELDEDEQEMKKRWWKAKNIMVRERGYKIDTGKDGNLIVKKPKKSK